ncbi:VOC family protein [Candidatus Saccharibacteria bacterium]|nr:VOC family protein [Candidatus Saccharibacteria bacterium]
MLNLNSIMLSSEKPKELAEFYSKVLDKKPDMEENNFIGFMAESCFLSIGGHDKVKGKNPAPEWIMMFFETKDVNGEFERIKGLGAKVIAEPYHPGTDNNDFWLATLADPDGNYFQLASPWNQE